MSLDNAQRARVLRRFPESWEEKAEKVYMCWRPFCLAAELACEDQAPLFVYLLELARQHAWNLPVPGEPTTDAVDRRFWTLVFDPAACGTTVVEVLGQALELAQRGMPPVAVLFGRGLVERVWCGTVKEPSFHQFMSGVSHAGIRIFLGAQEWQPQHAPAAQSPSGPTLVLTAPPLLSTGDPRRQQLTQNQDGTWTLHVPGVLPPVFAAEPEFFAPHPGWQPPLGDSPLDRTIRTYYQLRPEERHDAVWNSQTLTWRARR